MKLRKLKTPLISGDKIATHEKWVDVSGAGHYDWCPAWKERVFNKTISFKEIKNTRSYLIGEGFNIIEGRVPSTLRELEGMGKKFTLKVLNDAQYQEFKGLKINFYSFIEKIGHDIDTIMSDAGFIQSQEGRDTFWVSHDSFESSTDGFRNGGSYKKRVGLQDAVKKLYPEELKEEEERVETLKKEFLNKNSKELIFDFSDYKITK